MKSTKKQLLMSTISLLLCFSMLLGTTYAWFTDEVTSGKNTIRAGNLDVELYHGKTLPIEKSKANSVDGATNLFGVALWEPGVVAYENFTVANVGTLTLEYDLKLRSWDFNKTADGKDLTDVIKVYTIEGGLKPEEAAEAVTRQQAQGLSYTAFADYASTGVLLPDDNNPETDTDTKTFGVVLYWKPTDDDNDYNMNNGKTTSDGKPLYLDIGIDLVAKQKDQNANGVSEVDSFDETYDHLAEFPSIAPRITAFGSANGNRSSENGGVATEGVTVKIVKVETNGGEIGEVDVSPNNVNRVMNDAFGAIETPDTEENVSKIEDELVLNVKVETKDATTDSIKLDISMFANVTRTTTKNDGEQKVDKKENQPVTELLDPVTIPLQLEPQLEDVTVTHSHAGNEPESMTEAASKEAIADGQFYYEKNTGELFVKTSKFSDFAITYTRVAVASVNGTTYTTLEKAVENAKPGDTVEVLKDTDIPADIGKDITINVNNNVTASKVTVGSGNDITLTGNGGFYAEVDGTLHIKGGKYTDVEFKGNGTVYIENAEMDKLAVLEGNNVTINIKKGVYKDVVSAGKLALTIEDGEFEKFEKVGNGEIIITVQGGSFHLETEAEKNSVKEMLADNQYFKESAEEKWFIVATFDDNIVARIGDTGYTTLAGAVSAVNGGETVKLIKNVNMLHTHDDGSQPIDYKAGNRTFDLNGHTFTLDQGTWDFELGGVIYLASGWSGTYPNTTLTFKDSVGNGKFNCTKETTTPGHVVAAVGNDTHVAVSYVFESGTYQGETHGVYFTAGNVTINGGTFVGPIAFEYGADDYSGTTYCDLVINDGTFDGRFVVERIAEKKGDTGAKLNSVVVNGGKFKTDEASIYLADGKILVEEDGWFVVKDAVDAPETFTARVNNVYYTTDEGPNTAMNYAKKLNYATVELKAASTVALSLGINESITILGDTSLYTAPVAETGITTFDTEAVTGGIRYFVPDVKPFTVYRDTTKIGDFDTLDDAKKTANNASFIIKMNKDYTLTTNFSYSYQSSLEQNLTIDLQGHTLTLDDEINIVLENKRCLVTIKNGVLEGNYSGNNGMIVVQNGQETSKGFKLINMTVTNNGNGWVIYDALQTSSCGTKLIENCLINGACINIGNYTVIGNTVISMTNKTSNSYGKTNMTKAPGTFPANSGIVKDEDNYIYTLGENDYSITVTPKVS